MVISRESLTTEALTLPPDQRMTFAYRLLESVEPVPVQGEGLESDFLEELSVGHFPASTFPL